MNLVKVLIAGLSMTLAGAAANAAPSNAATSTSIAPAAAECVPQRTNAGPSGKGGWPAATITANTCPTLSRAVCATPERVGGFNGKIGFRIPAKAGVDCSGKATARL